MNKDIILGIFIGFILAVILFGAGGFFLFQKVAPMLGVSGSSQQFGNSNPQNGQGFNNYGSPQGSPSPQQQQGTQSNGTLFGCPDLKLVGTQTVSSGIPFTVQNTDSKPHKIVISMSEYNFAAGEKKTITVSGKGTYHPVCDGSSANAGELNVG